MALPDFFVIGAPKAGTTALHTALATHPALYLSPVKEPKFFLCDGTAPRGHVGPGDAHSTREWVWRRDRYEALFDEAPPGALRGESTPFYLYDMRAQERIRRLVPDAKLIALLRDPVDRAHSNWMHLWSDGLEPIPDFVAACHAEDARVDAGYAPFWHYRRLGRYGEQLAHLFTLFDPSQVHLLRYRSLLAEPARALAGVYAFLGVERDGAEVPAPENVRAFVPPDRRSQALGRVVRTGAALGAHLPPQVWRRASQPLLRALHRRGMTRPRLHPDERREVLAPLVDDIRLLERVTGSSFADWLGGDGDGELSQRPELMATGRHPVAVP